MNRNDKIIVLFGVLMLVLASVGIYYLAPEEAKTTALGMKELYQIYGILSDEPGAVTVSDSNPFYPLIATPLAVHYDVNCEQYISPLYIMNFDDPSSSVVKARDMIGFQFNELVIESGSAKNVSLKIAETYWESSKGVLLIEDNQSGYELGVLATPLASYLSIPVIVTSEVDQDVIKVLNNLGVEYSLVCGDIDGYGKQYKFNDADDVVDVSIGVVNNKFGDVDYITLTNPIDAWPPKVLDSKEFYFGPETVKSINAIRLNMVKRILNMLTGGGSNIRWEFTIPDDYKYALIELEGYNLDIEDVDTFGDYALFSIDPVDGGFTLSGGGSTVSGIPTRDEKGNIIEDKVRNEFVLYDCGGKTYSLSAGGYWVLKGNGKLSAKITIKKLEHAVYPTMKNLSTVAPYLTSYHKGIIFGKPEFGFAVNDEIITDDGKTCPGFYLPGRNPQLVPFLNKHIYDNIHKPLNKILAKLADLSYDKPSDLKYLTDYYKYNPIYIALIGDATVLPNYIYQNEVEPIGDIDGDGKDDSVAVSFGGGGTDSDNIYGNIDPVAYDWSNQEKDIYSEYPYLENIVGRIAAWDAQDADALIVRTIFYDKIIKKMSGWQDNFGNLNGGGTDFRKPLWLQVLNRLPIIKQILKIVYQASGGLFDLAVGPWKLDTGFGKIMAKAVESQVGKDLGFEVETALAESAIIDGYSDDALNQMKNQIKKINLRMKLTFSTSQIKKLVGSGNVKGREILENSNFLWLTGHGCPFSLGMEGPNLVASGFDGFILNAPKLWQKIWEKLIPYLFVGFMGPGSGLGSIGEYNARKISSIDFGPSFMWLESCTCGKINGGIYPEANIGLAFIHSGVNSLIASTTGSNIPGGYLEPKRHIWDTILSTNIAYKQWTKKAKQGIFPEFHFGFKIYNDLCQNLKDGDISIGRAFRDAKNVYLPEDADSKFWWTPPLTASSSAKSGYGTQLSPKYTSFNEYVLYGDPAFIPYVPYNER